MVRRAAYLSDSETAYQLLLEHYDELKEHYKTFFPQLKAFAKAKIEAL
jgi:acyl carrier protein phosphodiesterase